MRTAIGRDRQGQRTSLSADDLLATESIFSPRPSTSWMFCFMISCTSCKSSLSLLKLRCVRVSMYSFFVFWIKVSNLIKAYGRVAWGTSASTLEPLDHLRTDPPAAGPTPGSVMPTRAS